MITSKSISLLKVVKWGWIRIIWLMFFMGVVAALYYYQIISIVIPWLPVSVIGTAVAFYVGFKNNQSYDRMWEARKIWGGIVNDSRTWGSYVTNFISNQFTSSEVPQEVLDTVKKRLIYRHIAWLYAHRSQLLIPTEWEHISQKGHVRRTASFFQEQYGIGLVNDEVTQVELRQFLPEEEHDRLINYANTATQIINEQAKDLKELRSKNLIDDFRHMTISGVLRTFYELQGKNERIKKFPLPRQYANMSQHFVYIFILFIPFSMVPELMQIGEWGLWVSVPVSALVAWIYVMMDVVGDYSENPFQGMANDIPMLSLCRTIEIDLKEMLGETELPPPIKSKNGILM